MTPAELGERIAGTVLAFRGYDAGNLGRSREFIDHPVYGTVARGVLEDASRICSDATGESVDLVAYIREGKQAGPADLANDNACLVAMQMIHLRLLGEFFGVDATRARHSFGFSTGELAALTFSRVLDFEWLLRFFVPIARDCAELAPQACMAAVSARNGRLDRDGLEALCRTVRAEGFGLIGPTAYLSARAALVVGEPRAMERLERSIVELRGQRDISLKRKQSQWTPLHSPIVWRRSIPNRIATLLHDIPGILNAAVPPVASCVPQAGWCGPSNLRDLLPRWADHPQCLSDAAESTIASGASTVMHVGPSPDLIPRAFGWAEADMPGAPHPGRLARLARAAVRTCRGRAASPGLGHPRSRPPEAPRIVHVVLEDWLLSQTSAPGDPPCVRVAHRV
jgi:[acyl-carrier-protein] S-malonyltransferase